MAYDLEEVRDYAKQVATKNKKKLGYLSDWKEIQRRLDWLASEAETKPVETYSYAHALYQATTFLLGCGPVPAERQSYIDNHVDKLKEYLNRGGISFVVLGVPVHKGVEGNSAEALAKNAEELSKNAEQLLPKQQENAKKKTKKKAGFLSPSVPQNKKVKDDSAEDNSAKALSENAEQLHRKQQEKAENQTGLLKKAARGLKNAKNAITGQRDPDVKRFIDSQQFEDLKKYLTNTLNNDTRSHSYNFCIRRFDFTEKRKAEILGALILNLEKAKTMDEVRDTLKGFYAGKGREREGVPEGIDKRTDYEILNTGQNITTRFFSFFGMQTTTVNLIDKLAKSINFNTQVKIDSDVVEIKDGKLKVN